MEVNRAAQELPELLYRLRLGLGSAGSPASKEPPKARFLLGLKGAVETSLHPPELLLGEGLVVVKGLLVARAGLRRERRRFVVRCVLPRRRARQKQSGALALSHDLPVVGDVRVEVFQDLLELRSTWLATTRRPSARRRRGRRVFHRDALRVRLNVRHVGGCGVRVRQQRSRLEERGALWDLSRASGDLLWPLGRLFGTLLL